MDEPRSNILPFRRISPEEQGQLPLGRPASRTRPPLDDRRVAHRRRMLEFMRGQTLGLDSPMAKMTEITKLAGYST